ncbi:histidine kinase dimerization/phosphoacceptor domain -containing protein [Aquisalinus flavus]|uniref:Sensor histidine kinase n=1 Tax=Aquisalinus flavus TaxID=1526572 RepID=A0A8J2V538_9PROT|nr:histidine kinase dimerization/phosphoacceptor domain -containing protein [Aquisalinus flavus]MBD0427790.1 GAF domain-containing protein [Aquisalinus flavus]UNE47563.1 GAF domain-containing protein [Aquisalinus flavus]GGD03855.1 sensor histidine kinase [Aquisalinus flavus]
MKAASHPRQAERLEALYSYDILDTPREKDFDDIVKLASELCGTKYSVINLIDADRQWFKAETGFGIDETPLDTSICSHVILDHEFVEIQDTLDDTRTADNPLCSGVSGFRFYAGAQLRTENGLPLGTLCILDEKPKTLTETQKEVLRLLAHQIMKQLELRRTLKFQTVLQQEIVHRISNSLQTISSLINLRKRHGSSETHAALTDIGDRISIVAMLNEELSSFNNLKHIDMQRYLRRVVTLLEGNAPDNVALELNCDEARFTSSQAAAVAMIVNEFVTNSLKYAFPANKHGRIWIFLSMHKDNSDSATCTLTLRDNGIGNAASHAETQASGTGWGKRIIEGTAEQLQAISEWLINNDGYQLTITFQPDR